MAHEPQPVTFEKWRSLPAVTSTQDFERGRFYRLQGRAVVLSHYPVRRDFIQFRIGVVFADATSCNNCSLSLKSFSPVNQKERSITKLLMQDRDGRGQLEDLVGIGVDSHGDIRVNYLAVNGFEAIIRGGQVVEYSTMVGDV